MRRSMCVTLRRLLAVAVVVGWGDGAVAYLRLHPGNPHYLQETATGEAVMITGYGSVVPTAASYDYITGFRVEQQAYRVMYHRCWHILPWAGQDGIWPWAYSATGGGYWGGAGGNKVDFNVWNTTYWNRMKDALGQAQGAGHYVEIWLFDRVGMSPGTNERWGNNPWAANNNINNLEVPNAQPPNDGTPDFYLYATKPNLRNQQERYVRKMIDETIAYTNVLYEIENEHWDYNDPVWGDHYAQFVKSYIAANYPNSPRLVTYNSLQGDLESFYTLPSVDIVNKHYGGEPETPGIINTYIESRWHHNKAINIDEFANGVTDTNLLRRMCWETITSGGHFHIEDADLASNPYAVVENIRSFKTLANWDFISAAPNRGLIVSGGGYCLASPGQEYVCYFPSGGTKVVSLQAGTYRSEWWNPRTGGFSGVTGFTHGGGSRSFSTPDANDWVLHVTTRPSLDTILEAKPAGAIAIDGLTADWNLAEFTTPIHGGNVGIGDTAVVGFGGYQNWSCYKGGHWTGGQFPPASAADHAVRGYCRNDSSYLYFLFRMDDTDL
ncbi:MAG: hypothetical protein HY718_10530, partial [Planctomycetes bacterium]|nr:hypothetical protein [Planctomycetota bacterium]